MRGLDLTILPRAAAEGSALDAAAAATEQEEELQQTSLSQEGFARTALLLISTRVWRIRTVRSCWLIITAFGSSE
jgi:hypothetical protein